MPESKPVPYIDRKTGKQRRKGTRLGWRLRVVHDLSGKQVERTFYGTYEQAVVAIADLRAETQKATIDAVAVGKTITFAEFMVMWLEQQKWIVPPTGKAVPVRRKWSTYRRHMDQTRLLIRAIGPDTRLRALDHGTCVETIGSLRTLKDNEPFKPSSKETAARTLKAALKWGTEEGYLPANPAASLPAKWTEDGARARTVIPSLVELEAQATYLDAWTDDDIRGEIFGDVTRVLGYTGLRWSELVGLKVEDVEWEFDRLVIQRTVTTAGGRRVERKGLAKTAAGLRYVPILSQAVDPLTRLLTHSRSVGSEYVAAGVKGGSVNTSTWNRRLKAAREAKVAKIYSAHYWRHLFASILIASGETTEEVRRTMGHASITTTERVYRHALDLPQGALAKRLSSAVTRLEAETASLTGEN